MLRLITYLSILLLFGACTEVIELPQIESERKVVVNAVISTQDIWRVDLSYTKSITDPNPIQKVNDAKIKVINKTSGQVFEMDCVKQGQYKYHLNPMEGHEYDLEITTEEGVELYANTAVPNVIDIKPMIEEVKSDDDEIFASVKIDIIDDPNQENFYIWEIVPINKHSVLGESVIKAEEDETGESQEFTADQISQSFTVSSQAEGKEESEEKNLFDPVFFSDSDFEGTFSTTITVKKSALFSLVDNDPESTSNVESPRLKLAVMAVSKELYDRILSLQVHESSVNSPTSDGRTILYSNIENGRGIFGAYHLEEFPL